MDKILHLFGIISLKRSSNDTKSVYPAYIVSFPCGQTQSAGRFMWSHQNLVCDSYEFWKIMNLFENYLLAIRSDCNLLSFSY